MDDSISFHVRPIERGLLRKNGQNRLKTWLALPLTLIFGEESLVVVVSLECKAVPVTVARVFRSRCHSTMEEVLLDADAET